MANKTELEKLLEQAVKRNNETRGSANTEQKKSFRSTIEDRHTEAEKERTEKKRESELRAADTDPRLNVSREQKNDKGKAAGRKTEEMIDQLDLQKQSEERIRTAHSSALDKARRSKLTNGNSAADFVQSRSDRMGSLAIGDGQVNEDLKLEKALTDARRKYQWEEAGRRYDALSDEEKQAIYRRHNSSALDRARMSAEENPVLQGGGTVYDTRTAIGQNIVDRYYNLEEEVTNPNAAGGYAFLNRVRSAAGVTAENLGNWAYDTFGWEPGKETYERGEARKIGEIADRQLQNELAMHPTQTGQDFVKAADSIANMVSYKIASAPISIFASAVAGDLATNAALKKGSGAIGKAAKAGESVDADKIIAQAVEKGLKKSHDVSGSIFTSSMALGSFGDKYIESRAEGQGKLESSVRAVTAAVISYATESLGGIGGSKSPLNKLEDAAKKKWLTSVLYEAAEEGGEEFAEYALNYIANGIIDLVARGEWNQEWNSAEVWENMRVAGISGGMFGAASGGINKVFSGNAKIDAQLDSAGKEFLNYLDAVYKAEQDPAVRAAVEAQIDGMFDDAGIGVLANRNKAAEQGETEQSKAEPSKADTETEMLDQLDTAKEAERAAAREAETIRKTIESVKNSDLTADEKLARIKNLYNGSENAEARRALKAAFSEMSKEKQREINKTIGEGISSDAYESDNTTDTKFNDKKNSIQKELSTLLNDDTLPKNITDRVKNAMRSLHNIGSNNEQYLDSFNTVTMRNIRKEVEAFRNAPKNNAESDTQNIPVQNTEQVQPLAKPEATEQIKPEATEQVQPAQEAAGQALRANEETNAPAKQAPEKAAQSGAQRTVDRGTRRRAYAEYSKDNPSAMDKKKFDKLYTEAYNAESFDDFLSKHEKLGNSLKKVLQKAFDNGHRAEAKAAKNAMLDSGLVMNDGDEYMLNNRGDIDTLIDSYERAIEDGYVPIETAGENQDKESLADQYRELSDSDIENYRNAIEKLKKYEDEHFPKAKQGVSTGNKDLSTGNKGLSTEQKNLSTDNKGLSTETSTSKETKRLESVIKNLTELKRNLENGNMEKLEHQNPEKYNSLMYKLEQRTTDKNGSDYFGSAEDVQVLIDKYKADLDVLKAENGAQRAQFDSGKKAVYNESNQYATVAPYYNTEVTAENKQQVKEAVDSAFRKKAEETAKSIGIKLKGDASNMGGFTFSEGEAAGQQVHEISYSFEFEDATPEQVQLFASLMAENGYEQQEAVIQKRYVANIDDGNAYEYTIRYRNLNSFEVAKALERAGITDYTIDETNSVVQVLEFDTQNNTAVRNQIDSLIANEGEENFYGTDYNAVQSEYLDERSRAGLYRSWLEEGKQDGQLRDYISESLRKVEERIRENERAAERREVKTETNTGKADAESTGSFNAQNTDEYSPEYQNGAEHPGTVGGMESDRSNITRAANESGVLPAKKNPFSDFDKYKADENVPSGEKAALARTINDPMLGEITVAQNVTNMVKDGAKFVARDGFFYAQYEDGTSVKVSKSAYNFGKFLNEQGVQYTLNQNAEMPQRMGKKYVSKAVTSFIASRGGTDAVVEAIQAKLEAGDPGYVYERKGHEKIRRAAGEKIVEMGFDGAVEFFRERAQGDYKYTSELNALGIMLSNIAAESNTKEGTNLATTIMGWVAANQTNAGQVTESMKLVRKLVENNSEIYYQSLVDSLQEKYKKELKGENITLDMDLLKKVSETAGTKENAKWTDKLNISIANQIPATSLEKLNAFRYFCMLSSGRTHAKNIISNAAMFTMVVQKNLWLSVFERMYKAKNPGYMLTTSGLKTSADSQRFAREIFDVLKSNMDSGGSKYTPGDFVQYRTNTMQGNGKYAKYNLPGWVLDRFANATTGLLSAEDMVAKKALFVNRFSQIMEANGWTAEFLSDKADAKAIRAYENAANIAIEEAMKGTSNDKNPWTNVINAWRKMETIDFHDRSSKAFVGTLIETMLPFKNVPLNIAKTAIQYSPIGIVNGVIDLNRGVKNGTLDPRIALENIAKGATGTTVSVGGLMLAMMGFLTLGKGRDEDKPIAEKEDTTMYLKFPDEEKGNVYIEIDWIDSVAMQLRFGLELKDIVDNAIKAGKDGEDTISILSDLGSSFLASATRTMDTFMDIGMMSSVQNILLNKSGAKSMNDVLTDKIVNLGTQFIPRLLTDIRQAFDKEKRNTYYNNGGDAKWLQLLFNQYRAAYGDRSKLPARLDEWGNSLGEENDAKRIIESMISPSKWYREDKDKVEEMLDQLDTKVDDNVFPGDYPKQITVNGEKIKLSGKEYEEVARQIGKERYKLLDELRKDKSFQKLSADEKAEIIQKCYTIANEMAKAGFDDDYSISTVTRNVQDAEKAKIPISTYLTIAQAYSNMAEYEKNGVTVSTSEQLAEYLIKDKSTTAEEDIKLFELLTRKKKDGSYSSPLDNIKKVPDADAEEQLKLYQITKIKDKEEAIQTYMLEGYSSAEALARYNVAKGAKTKYSGLGKNQKKKTDKLLAASKSGKTECKWTEEKLTLAACAVTSVGDYGTLKTQKYYVQMLMAVGFTEKEAKEFYKYYA